MHSQVTGPRHVLHTTILWVWFVPIELGRAHDEAGGATNAVLAKRYFQVIHRCLDVAMQAHGMVVLSLQLPELTAGYPGRRSSVHSGN